MSNPDCFRIPAMLTITVNRRSFSSPEAAYDHIMGKKFIARLLTKDLGVRYWVAFMQPQEGSGDGWPHWHILVDKSCLPTKWNPSDTGESSLNKPGIPCGRTRIPHFLDLEKAHRLLLKWGLGGCHLSDTGRAYASREHAINSITSYMTKAPRRGYPLWMLERRRSLRMFSCSACLSKAIRSRKHPAKPGQVKARVLRASPAPGASPTTRRAHLDRISECGHKVSFIRPDVLGNRVSTVPCLAEWVYRAEGLQESRFGMYLDAAAASELRFSLAGPLVPGESLRPWDSLTRMDFVRQRIADRKFWLLHRWDTPSDPLPGSQEDIRPLPIQGGQGPPT